MISRTYLILAEEIIFNSVSDAIENYRAVKMLTILMN